MLAEYKAFLLRGNLLDLAVAFVLGAAFNTVVSALANDVIMATVAGLLDLEGVEQMRWGPLHVGSFLAALVTFVVVATVLFLLIRAARNFDRPDQDDVPAPDSDEVILLREIRDELRARPSSSSERSA